MNLPNKLSLMRIAFVPVAAVVFLCGELSASFQNGIYVGSVFLQYSDLLVLLLFAAASITDFLDGYIARRNHLITSFGKFIDPIADKLRNLYENDRDKLARYTQILYAQARLIGGMEVNNPAELTEMICDLMV